MAEPFVFHFKPDERGFPGLMSVADVKAECGLCQHDEIQRFYRALPFHSMTVERLLQIADEVPSWAGYECANCGTEVGPEHVVASMLMWGFADDSGLVRIFGTGPDAVIQLVPGRRLDPQELPGFEPPADQGTVVPELSEQAVEDVLERPFNLKLAIREFVAESAESSEGGWAPLARGMWLADGVGPVDIDDPDIADASLVRVALDDAPTGLPGLADPVGMPGRVETWLGTPLPPKVMSREIVAWVDRRVIRAVVERAFNVARLDFEADEYSVGDIQTPREQTYPHRIDYDDIAHRAAYTGISPGEAARLTAEEIVASLLDVKQRR